MDECKRKILRLPQFEAKPNVGTTANVLTMLILEHNEGTISTEQLLTVLGEMRDVLIGADQASARALAKLLPDQVEPKN